MNSPITTLPGFPFFYAIPIDGQIREIPSQPQMWTEELEAFAEDHNILLRPHPPPYSKPLPQLPISGQLPSVREIDETFSMIPPSYLPIIVPDDDLITPQTARAKTEPIPKTRTHRRKIRYLSIGRWGQPSFGNDGPPKATDDFDNAESPNSEAVHKRRIRFLSLSSRSSWASLRPSTPRSLSASAAASTTSINLPRVLEMPPELEAIEIVVPTSPFNELDSTPINELCSETFSEQSPSLPELRFSPLPDFQFTCDISEDQPRTPPTPDIPDRSPYRSWYSDEDDSGDLAEESPTETSTDLPPHHPGNVPASSSPPPPLDPDSGSNCSSNRSSQWSEGPKDFEGDVKENLPDMASLPARRQSILLMTEEEVMQSELIEDIFLMLHDLQPNYLHPAHRPQPNVIRASLIRRYAMQIAHAERLRQQA